LPQGNRSAKKSPRRVTNAILRCNREGATVFFKWLKDQPSGFVLNCWKDRLRRDVASRALPKLRIEGYHHSTPDFLKFCVTTEAQISAWVAKHRMETVSGGTTGRAGPRARREPAISVVDQWQLGTYCHARHRAAE
jgi:hypothetical protein